MKNIESRCMIMIQSDIYQQFNTIIIVYFLPFVFLFEFFARFLRVNLNLRDLPPVAAAAALLTISPKELPWDCELAVIANSSSSLFKSFSNSGLAFTSKSFKN